MKQHVIVGKLRMMVCPQAMDQAESKKYEVPNA
jgi:hypothetical protein